MKVSQSRITRFATTPASTFRPTVRRLPVLLAAAFAFGATSAQAFLPGTGTLSAAAETTASSEQWVPGRLLVQPRPGLADGEFDKIIKPHGGKKVGKIDRIDVHIVEVPAKSERAVEVLLRKNKHLKFAERDMIVAEDATTDPYYGSAWHLPKIGADIAWATSSGNGVTIAILDSGVDTAHPDLAGKLLPGWNFYDGNSNLTDVTGHGTKVAGTAAAATNNAVGVASVAGAAMILPGRIASPTGTASFSTMAAGVTWAADKGARVANISYSGARGSSTVWSAGNYIKSKGGVLVVSGGNTGTVDTSAPSDALIAVSATTSTDARASWSSYGSYIDVAAPGEGIWTTTNGGGYASVSGTSFASPATAGVIALMMAANPKLAPADITKLLFATAVDLGTLGYDNYFGNGRINAAVAVEAAAKASAPSPVSDTTAPVVSVSSPLANSTVSGLVVVDVSATDASGVSRVELMAGNTLVATDTSAPYGFSWDSTTVADGSASLTATAYDAAGNKASKAVTVTVANAALKILAADSIPPVASITNPAAGSTVSGVVSVKGSATDNVGVSAMRLYIDGKLVSSAVGSSLSYSWNTKKASTGSHSLVLTAEDAAGNLKTTSVSVNK